MGLRASFQFDWFDWLIGHVPAQVRTCCSRAWCRLQRRGPRVSVPGERVKEETWEYDQAVILTDEKREMDRKQLYFKGTQARSSSTPMSPSPLFVATQTTFH